MGSLPPVTLSPRRAPAFAGHGKTDEADETRSIHETDKPAVTRKIHDIDAPDDQYETRRPRRNSEDQAPKRTRLGIFWDMTKRYVYKSRFTDMQENNLARDVALASVIGSILAIGSPLAIVTIPTSVAIWTAVSMTFLAISAMRDPHHPDVSAMYQQWREKDAEKAASR